MKPKLARRRISDFSLMSVRCVSLRGMSCSRPRFLRGIANILSSWPIIRATTPRREREISNVASPSYRFVVPRDQTSDVNTKPVGHFSDRR